MLNTAKNTIKKAAKDQVEFVGAILTGVFVGSIFTLAYIKFWVKGDVTFADIGGMLAGAGTVGLLVVAIKTTNAWKKQSYHEQKINSLEDFSSKMTKFYSQSSKIIMLLAGHAMNEPSEKGAPTNIKNPTLYINELNELAGLVAGIESSIIRLEAVWAIKIKSNLLSNARAMYRLRDSLKSGQSIFFTHNKAMTSYIDHHIILKEEIDELYKQLNQ